MRREGSAVPDASTRLAFCSAPTARETTKPYARLHDVRPDAVEEVLRRLVERLLLLLHLVQLALQEEREKRVSKLRWERVDERRTLPVSKSIVERRTKEVFITSL